MLRDARVPGGGSTDQVGVRRWLDREEVERAGAKRVRTDDADQGEGEADGTHARRRRKHVQYDETRRRQRRKRQREGERYVDRSRHTQRKGSLKRSIEVGPHTLDRIVAGRYEWRDAGLRGVRGARRDMWDGNRQWDPGGW